MRVNKKFCLPALFLILTTGCIEPFTPTINENQRLLVIEGQITDQAGFQYIYISRTSPYNDPQIMPEPGCYVEVVSDRGNIFQFHENVPGKYQRWMNQGSLVPGTLYKMRVITGDGNEYQSDFNILPPPCPPIDDLYYEIETLETNDPEFPLQGIQFYIDVDPHDDIERKFRWELVETWEYEAANLIQYYYDGALHPMADPWRFFRCWKTDKIHTIYAKSTQHSADNKIKKYPLNYVSNQSNRLRIRYSLLVKQYSLSDEAFEYWYQLQKQSQESGGLYETQPAQVTGSIYNVDDPEELVLGYFNVSSVAEKRIFVDENFPFRTPGTDCELDTIGPENPFYRYVPFPIYLISLSPMGQGPPYGTGRGMCFDCRKGGGITEKPSFWK